MKIVFLDFDGVVNNSKDANQITLPLLRDDGVASRLTRWSASCIPSFIELLKLCDIYGYKIVISSTWRLFTSNPDVFNEYFITHFRTSFMDISDKSLVIGVTKFKDAKRGTEILDYLDNHDVSNYIIIDDDMFDIINNPDIDKSKCIKINNDTGLNSLSLRDITTLMQLQQK